MSTIKGIFEPFQQYVKTQLDLRKIILSNPDALLEGVYQNLNLNQEWTGTETESKTDQLNTYLSDYLSNSARLGERFKTNPEMFYTYTTEKQAIIRMMSGVDIKKIADTNGFLEDIEKGKKLNDGLARQYILQSGTLFYGGGGTQGGLREGFTTGRVDDDATRGFSYGDMNVRADADNDYGVVPMPGIIDAEIRTKSSDGSLREAKVNFRAHNRRQLAVLEVLYMRPGYPVAIEWGWNPFINNKGVITQLDSSVFEKFFNQNSTFEELNLEIRKYKLESSGNYDGFIGYVKNFSFKAREDGGFDCTTEIIAAGEILESLKSTKRVVKTKTKIPTYTGLVNGEITKLTKRQWILAGSPIDFEEKMEEGENLEVIDNLLYFLRSIKNNLNKSGDAFYLKKIGTEQDTQLSSFGGCPPKYKGVDLLKSEILNPPTGGPPVLVCSYDLTGEGDYETISITLNPSGTYEDSQMYTIGEAAPTNENTLEYKRYALNEPAEYYDEGFDHIVNLYKFINKIKEGSDDDKILNGSLNQDATTGQGIQSILGGSIIRQVVKYNEEYNKVEQGRDANGNPTYLTMKTDSGYRKNIYVRWDLLCQIMNHLANFNTDKPEIQSSADLMEPLTEFTYLNPNQPTWNNSPVSDGKSKPNTGPENGNGGYFYLPYAPPIHFPSEPPIGTDDMSHTRNLGTLDGISPTTTPTEGDPGVDDQLIPSSGTIIDISEHHDYHPLIGSSYDERICLLPHQPIFNSLWTTGQTFVDADPRDTNTTREATDASFGPISSYELGANLDAFNRNPDVVPYNPNHTMRHSIGLIFFNLDFVLDTYEDMRLNKSSADGSTYVTLNRDFNIFDFVKRLWDGVNDACGGFYKFQLHTEHERPGHVRIIDKRVSGIPNSMYEFNPQGLASVTREFYFDSSIDNDMAATISVAAQAPNNSQSLESLSFKSFHKNIKSRFTPLAREEDKKVEAQKAKDLLEDEVKKYKDTCNSVLYYIYKLNQGNFEVPNDNSRPKLLNHSEAIMKAEEIPELRRSILAKYPLSHKYAGQWRGDTPIESQAIIPLKYNAKLDGIAGMIPLQLFKVNKEKLPKGYERDDLAFVIHSETHRITEGQDWTVDIEGQMVLLNRNWNYDGIQTFENQKLLDDKDLTEGLTWLEWEISSNGIGFIQGFESFRSTPYEDPTGSGKYAVGYGTQTWKGKAVTFTEPASVTKTEATEQMQVHLRTKVYPHMREHIKVELSENQFDAIVSYIYNIGSINGSKFLTFLNNENFIAASKEIDPICSGGEVYEGLIQRRGKEQALFNTGNYDGELPPRRHSSGCYY